MRLLSKGYCASTTENVEEPQNCLQEGAVTLFEQPLGKLANMIEKHLEGILAHWESHVTNAYMEALNSVFSATKRKARGYRTTENLITMLYFVAGKLNIPSAIYH